MTLPITPTGMISEGRIDNAPRIRIETVTNSMSRIFPQRTQHMNEYMSYIPNKKVMIEGQLEVSGDILVAGKSLTEHIEYANTELVNENKDLKKRVEELEKLVNMLWYAPGMPGCEESKMDFDSVLGTLPKGALE